MPLWDISKAIIGKWHKQIHIINNHMESYRATEPSYGKVLVRPLTCGSWAPGCCLFPLLLHCRCPAESFLCKLIVVELNCPNLVHQHICLFSQQFQVPMGVEIRVFVPPQTQPTFPPRVDIGMLPPLPWPKTTRLGTPYCWMLLATWQELNAAQTRSNEPVSGGEVPLPFRVITTKRLWLDEMPIEIWNKTWIQLRNLRGILFQWKVSVPLSFAPWPSAQASTSHCRGNGQSCEAWDLDTTGTIRWIFSAFQSWKSHLVVPPFLEGWWWFFLEGLGDFLSFEKVRITLKLSEDPARWDVGSDTEMKMFDWVFTLKNNKAYGTLKLKFTRGKHIFQKQFWGKGESVGLGGLFAHSGYDWWIWRFHQEDWRD